VVRNAAIFCSGEAKKNISRKYPEGAVDTGQLKTSITYEKAGENTYRVGTNVTHAPYIEFGTKPHHPPLGNENSGLIRWAIRHMGAAKGKTPVFGKVRKQDRLMVASWIAYSIAWKIARYGTPPRPFLRPAFSKAKQKLLQDLKEKYK